VCLVHLEFLDGAASGASTRPTCSAGGDESGRRKRQPDRWIVEAGPTTSAPV
jgi:hypothetical protein